MRQPPKLIRIFAEHSLPPSYRAQVLGDLEERFRLAPPRLAARRYCRDAASAVWRVLWSERSPLRLTDSDLRKRAEAFQDSIWRRNIVNFLVWLPLLIQQLLRLVRDTSIYPRVLHLLAIVLLTIWLRATWTRAAARSVPASVPENELRLFHRAALIRRRDHTLLVARELLFGGVLLLALWLPTNVAEIRDIPDFMWGLFFFPFGLMLAFLIPRTRRNIVEMAKKLQQEIDSLEVIS